MDKVMVIGIAGGTGSGKTTITRKLMQRFGHEPSDLRLRKRKKQP